MKGVKQFRRSADHDGPGSMADGGRASLLRPGALRPTAIYFLLGVLWILASDRLLASLVQDQRLLTTLQTVKGWAFVVLSALVMYSLVRREIGHLKKAEGRFRSLVEHALAGVCVIQNERLVYVNSRLAQIFGASVTELLAVRDFRRLVVEQDRWSLDEILARASGSRRTPAVPGTFGSRTLRIVRNDGAECPVEVAAQPLQWQGSPAIIAMVLDRSEEERLEEQLRHAQKMEAIGQLTGSIAHDFNNLLTAAGIPIQLALLELEEEHAVRRDLEEARRAVERATLLSQQLLTFSRRRVTRPRPVDLSASVENLVQMLKHLVGVDVELVVELGALEGHVLIDPSHLEQVVTNLVVNARDALADGGSITIRTLLVDSNPDVLRHREGLRPGPHAILEVSDTGHGIEEGVKQRIFEPFFTTKKKGTGLGLSTAFGIIRQAEGFIRVLSERGRGTSMQVYLPLHEPSDHTAERPANEGNTGAVATSTVRAEQEPGGTILVVDDDLAVLKVFDSALSRVGYHVITADHPEEALSIAQQPDLEIDLLIADLMLPGMDGIALGAEFTKQRPSCRVMYCTAYSEGDIAEKIRDDPTMVLLEKPFQLGQLIQRVGEMLAGPRAEAPT
jgi:PAS domain S-box-containing protein